MKLTAYLIYCLLLLGYIASMFIGVAILPIGLLLFGTYNTSFLCCKDIYTVKRSMHILIGVSPCCVLGWGAQKHVFWIVPDIVSVPFNLTLFFLVHVTLLS